LHDFVEWKRICCSKNIFRDQLVTHQPSHYSQTWGCSC
jgi:hypothetical protein